MLKTIGALSAAAILALSLTACGATSAASAGTSGQRAADAVYSNGKNAYNTIPDYMLDTRLKNGETLSVDGTSAGNAARNAAKNAAANASGAAKNAGAAAKNAGAAVKNAVRTAGTGMNLANRSTASAK